MRRLISRTIATVALVATVVVLAAPAQAQRLSLAERVDRLEQQQSSQGAGGNAVDRVNQIDALQSQVQALQGQVEELRHALDEASKRNRDQYIDLDSRINRIEGGVGAANPPAAAASAPAQPADIELGAPGKPAPTSGDHVSTAPSTAPTGIPAEPAGDPTTAYNEAFAALKDGRYVESARRFQSFIDQYPNAELTGNAYYWLGESYYVTQNYPIAEESFRTLLARYPGSQKAPDALLKIGYSQYEMKQWSDAEATLNQVVQTYPDSTVARLAQGRLRALKMEGQR